MTEKASQVLRMDRIYDSASTVIVWFGVEHKDVGVVLNYMQKIGRLFEGYYRPWTEDKISRFSTAQEKAFPLVKELNDLIRNYIQ